MNRVAVILALFLAMPALAQQVDPPSEQAGNIAHGAEEEVEEMTDPGEHETADADEMIEPHGDEAYDSHHETQTFLGLPAWIWKLANMLLFLGFLYYLLSGPIKNYFAQRKVNIKTTLTEAEERRQRAERMSEEINAKIAALESEIAEIRSRADEEGQRIAAQISESTDRDLEKVRRAAKAEIDQRLNTARRDLREHAAKLASERAEEILESSITEADRDRIFEQGLSRLEEAK